MPSLLSLRETIGTGILALENSLKVEFCVRATNPRGHIRELTPEYNRIAAIKCALQERRGILERGEIYGHASCQREAFSIESGRGLRLIYVKEKSNG